MIMSLRIAVAMCVLGAAIGAQTPSWPVGRARHHVVYDPVARVMLTLNGAQAVNDARRDTALWGWNGAAWRALPGIPVARANEAVAFDTARGRLVVLGGSSPDMRARAPTWRFVESRRGDIVAPPLGECDASSAESLSSDASMPASPVLSMKPPRELVRPSTSSAKRCERGLCRWACKV